MKYIKKTVIVLLSLVVLNSTPALAENSVRLDIDFSRSSENTLLLQGKSALYGIKKICGNTTDFIIKKAPDGNKYLRIYHPSGSENGFSTYEADISGNWKLSFSLLISEKCNMSLRLDGNPLISVKEGYVSAFGQLIDTISYATWQTIEIYMSEGKDKALLIILGTRTYY